MRSTSLALLFLAGCTPKPEEPSFFLQRVEERVDGSTLTWTYSGTKPPPQWADLPDAATVNAR